MKKKYLILIVIFSAAVLIVCPFVGSAKINIQALKDFSLVSVEAKIFYQIRLPRVITSFLAGAALACCGVALQAMFRNPLATPFTLGISGGAAFGAALSVLLGAWLNFSAVPVFFAFGGAIAAAGLVYGLAQARSGFSSSAMLLAGVAVNFFFSSLILLLQYLSDFTQSFAIIHWLMGSCDIVGYKTPLIMAVFIFAGIAAVVMQSARLNLMSISDEIAASRGVNVRSARKIIFFATSVMVGAVVAFCGPIGFVGLMSPHICRLLVGADCRPLTFASVIFGGAFLTLCDTVARTLIAPAQIPVGVITALLGGPFFLWLLLKNPNRNL